jgi:hypothetical protein
LGKRLQTAFFDDIGVYHKRRTDLGKFSKQVYQFGCARPILNQRHPNYVKPTFWFPTLFLLGYVAGILEYFLLHKGFVLACYGIYTFIIFFHALLLTKNFLLLHKPLLPLISKCFLTVTAF